MSVFSMIKPLAYLSLPVFAIHTLAKANPVVRYYYRVGIWLSTLGLCSMWGILVALGMNVVDNAYNVNFVVARSFYALASRALDLKVVIEGEEYLDTRPAVLVGNHQSMLDIIVLARCALTHSLIDIHALTRRNGRVFPKRASIMAKKEVQWMPLLGQWMALSRAVFVDRGNSANAIRSLSAAGETIKARHTSLWMFPEGTRSMREHHDMLPFKKGAFHVAVEAGVPIVPVICENYWRLYRTGVFDSGTIKVKGKSARACVFRDCDLLLSAVLPPIPTTGLTAADVTALSARIREMMVETLREISPPVPGQKAAESTEEPAIEKKEPLSALTSLPSVVEAGPDTTPESPHSRAESRASTYGSEDFSASSSRHEGSEAGMDTEEDEGMVLVGRPPAP